MRHTPLFAQHVAQGASVINLKGVARPMEYVGHVAEHKATREAVTLCDVSHMGELVFTGSDSEALLARIIVGNPAKLSPGKVMYSALCDDHGFVMDDLVLMRLEKNRWLMVVNVTMIEKDYQWILRHNDFKDAVVENISTDMALMALQGPFSRETLQIVCEADLSLMEYYSCVETQIATIESDVVPCVVSRTGYTGELGFEICCERQYAPFIWRRLMTVGRPFGIMGHGVAARESLRTEAGLLLNGNDMDGQATPYEAGLGWLVDMSHDFIGKEALQKAKEAGPSRKMVGLVLKGRPTMRNGYKIYLGDEQVGTVTSGPISQELAGASLGLGYVRPDLSTPGQLLEVEIFGERFPVTVTKLPFKERNAKMVPPVTTLSPFGLSFIDEMIWCKKITPREWIIGLTEYAVSQLGECLYYKPGAPGTYTAESPLAWADSYRMAWPMKLPVAADVLSVRDDAIENPLLLNRYPYRQDGLMTVHFEELPPLMDFDAYLAKVTKLSGYAVWSKAKRTV